MQDIIFVESEHGYAKSLCYPFLAGLTQAVTQKHLNKITNKSPLVKPIYLQYLLSDMGPQKEENNTDSILCSWNMERNPVTGDGDCLFTSVSIHIMSQINAHPNTIVSKYLYNLNFNMACIYIQMRYFYVT